MYVYAATSSPTLHGDAEFPGLASIPRPMARRMTAPLQHAIGCALAALKEAGIEQPDGIFHATGLGCLHDTHDFLREIEENAGGLLSPTAFMRSTHNTVAGLIALVVKATGPNLSFSQGMLSFHGALLSAHLHVLDHTEHTVLVGASDEHIPLLSTLAQELRSSADRTAGLDLREGSAFLVMGAEKKEAKVRIADVWSGAVGSGPTAITEACDLVLLGPYLSQNARPYVPENTECIPVGNTTGLHQSTPAQAMVIACEKILSGTVSSVLISDRDGAQAGLIRLEAC